MFNESRNNLRFDTADCLTIKPSALKSIGCILIALCVVAFGIWLIQGGTIRRLPSFVTICFGWIVSPLFAVIAVVIALELVLGRSPKLVLSPSGLYYPPAHSREIPWSAVTGVTKWKYRYRHRFHTSTHETSFVKLHFRPGEYTHHYSALNSAMATLQSLLARFQLLQSNEQDCTFISSRRLQTSKDELFTAIYSYARAHSPALNPRVE